MFVVCTCAHARARTCACVGVRVRVRVYAIVKRFSCGIVRGHRRMGKSKMCGEYVYIVSHLRSDTYLNIESIRTVHVHAHAVTL